MPSNRQSPARYTIARYIPGETGEDATPRLGCWPTDLAWEDGNDILNEVWFSTTHRPRQGQPVLAPLDLRYAPGSLLQNPTITFPEMPQTQHAPTRVSFLQRLVAGDPATWQDFDAAYKPLLRHWLRNSGLDSGDTEDLIQEVMLFVSAHLEDFEHNTRTGAFRKWLRHVTVNIARNFLRKRQRDAAGLENLHTLLGQLAEADSGVSRAFEWDCQKALLHQLLRRCARGFSAETMSMFRQHVLEGAAVAETAEAHRVSRAAVYIAKSRVLRRLREEWAESVELEPD